jgi:tRNA pseudouridine38-40 synthase
MQRYKLTLEYDGAPFVGWQSQASGLAVQDRLATAIEKFCGETPTIFAAGRTDSGVHARGQVAHIDLASQPEAHKLRDGLNFHLKPDPIAILVAEPVDDEFHARFAAVKRHYLYRIIARRAPLALDRAYAWWVPQELNIAAMHDAAQALRGQHDFTTFRASQCQAASPVKTVDHISVRCDDDGIIRIEVSARSFLHHQVRSFAGALKYVGEGKWAAHDLADALKAADRAACAPVAPPHGLYFMRVDYPEK